MPGRFAEVARNLEAGVALDSRAAERFAIPAEPLRGVVVSSGAAMWRWRMPVRSTIQSSLVSNTFSRSLLVTMRAGR